MCKLPKAWLDAYSKLIGAITKLSLFNSKGE